MFSLQALKLALIQIASERGWGLKGEVEAKWADMYCNKLKTFCAHMKAAFAYKKDPPAWLLKAAQDFRGNTDPMTYHAKRWGGVTKPQSPTIFSSDRPKHFKHELPRPGHRRDSSSWP